MATLERQQELSTKITNSFSNFRKLGKDKMTLLNAEIRLQSLEKYYNNFYQNHEHIVADKIYKATDPYFQSNIEEATETAYYEAKEEFKNFIASCASAQNSNNTTSITNHLNGSISNHAPGDQFSDDLFLPMGVLPKMDIPKFSGKYTEWESFRDIFKAMVHDRRGMKTVVKFFYLKTSVTGEAADRINKIAIT